MSSDIAVPVCDTGSLRRMSSTHSSTSGTVTADADPVDAGGELLHRGEIGRIDPGIGEVDHVGPFAGDVRRGVLGAALRRPRRRLAREPAVLHVGPQSPPGLEVDDRLGLPGVGPGGRPVQVEVVVVAAQLDEGLRDRAPPIPAPRPAQPHPERPVGQQVLRPRRKAEIGLGALALAEVLARGCGATALVDLGAAGLLVAAHRLDLVGDAGRRLVAEVAVLGADDADRRPRRAARRPTPLRPRIGVSERRVQGEPRNRMRAIASRATMSGSPASGGVASVIRMCFTRRSVGVPMVAVGVRSGMR